MGLPIAQAYGKAGNAISPCRRHGIGVGVHGCNIDKNSQWVPEDFNPIICTKLSMSAGAPLAVAARFNAITAGFPSSGERCGLESNGL
ncbi:MULTISPECIES: hypothetical protein [Burkholderia]|uniref:hypothetical protein n=1 Tax=Burkholderia TaxID=32008 RepID=UPI0011C4DEEB|nr:MULTISPECIES: hypothetical protein [Burkholderia]